MFVIRFKDGKFCKFGSYKRASTVSEPYHATLYKDFNKATAKLGFKSGGIVENNIGFWINGEKFGIENFQIVHINITWQENTCLSFGGE